jgi:hypothetical protein
MMHDADPCHKMSGMARFEKVSAIICLNQIFACDICDRETLEVHKHGHFDNKHDDGLQTMISLGKALLIFQLSF